MLQKDMEETERRRLERHLQQVARNLDLAVADQVRGWLLELGRDDELRVREQLHRQQVAWFDAFYLWEPGARGPEFLFPPQPLVENEQTIMSAPCMVPYKLPLMNPYVVASLLQSCRNDRDPMVRLFAATRSAEILLGLDKPENAWSALRSANVSFSTPLDKASDRGLPPERLLQFRLQVADTLTRLGRPDQARDVLLALTADIGSQDGPVLEEVLPALEWEIVPRLRQMEADQEAMETDALIGRAERRLAAWREIREALAPRGEPPEYGEEPGLVYDVYGDPPFLLLYSKLDVGEQVGAIQLEQNALLDELLTQAGEDRQHLVVRNADGVVIAGEGSSPVLVEVPFQTLGHLRLGYRTSILGETTQNIQSRAFWPLVPPVLGFMIGALALLARLSGDRREQELIDRQREFTARVTHELKTPLTGIRLMAENLEMGMCDDPVLTKEFSRRILDESDRLTERVNQILEMGRARDPGRPELVELYDLLEELADEWEPRMEDAGVILERDLQPVTLEADPLLLRDALACLLDNALKYRDEEHEDSGVWLSCGREGNKAVVVVADNGIGIPPEKRQVIFERFARVEGPNRGKAGGHGLGLAFVAEAVKNHRGRVEAKDGVDGGIRFVVKIPISKWTTRLEELWQRLISRRLTDGAERSDHRHRGRGDHRPGAGERAAKRGL